MLPISALLVSGIWPSTVVELPRHQPFHIEQDIKPPLVSCRRDMPHVWCHFCFAVIFPLWNLTVWLNTKAHAVEKRYEGMKERKKTHPKLITVKNYSSHEEIQSYCDWLTNNCRKLYPEKNPLCLRKWSEPATNQHLSSSFCSGSPGCVVTMLAEAAVGCHIELLFIYSVALTALGENLTVRTHGILVHLWKLTTLRTCSAVFGIKNLRSMSLFCQEQTATVITRVRRPSACRARCLWWWKDFMHLHTDVFPC